MSSIKCTLETDSVWEFREFLIPEIPPKNQISEEKIPIKVKL